MKCLERNIESLKRDTWQAQVSRHVGDLHVLGCGQDPNIPHLGRNSSDLKTVYYQSRSFTILCFLSLTPTLVAFTWVTKAHGPSPQPTACRSPSCSFTTATGSNQALSFYSSNLICGGQWKLYTVGHLSLQICCETELLFLAFCVFKLPAGP